MNIAALGIGIDNRTPVDTESYQQASERNVALPLNPVRLPIRLDVVAAIDAALPAWSGFEPHALSTLYQNSLWCRAWMETVGKARSVWPRIVLARDSGGTLRFILPLQIRRRQGVRVLEWLGSPHHNYGYGLFDPGFMPSATQWFADNWDQLLGEIGGFDAIALTEMPDRIFGAKHPMLGLANLRAANPSFNLALDADFEVLYARKKSAERRRAARKHENALAHAGPVSFGLPGNTTEIHALIDIMFSHQEQRLAELGIHGAFGSPERQFIHRLADLQNDDDPILALYHLTCRGDVLAVLMGGLHGNCYWALISSLAAGPLRKHSPGELALRRTVEACCQRGFTTIDFAAGDSNYKRAWSDEAITMSVILRGSNLLGVAWAGAMAARLLIKRSIKRSPLLLGLSQSLRRLILARRP